MAALFGRSDEVSDARIPMLNWPALAGKALMNVMEMVLAGDCGLSCPLRISNHTTDFPVTLLLFAWEGFPLIVQVPVELGSSMVVAICLEKPKSKRNTPKYTFRKQKNRFFAVVAINIQWVWGLGRTITDWKIQQF